jgi:hypothetical protein
MSTDKKTFCISHGLRGCYMPDGEPWELTASSLSEMIDALADECDMYSDGGETMCYDRDHVMVVVEAAWEEAHKERPAYLPYCIPMANIPYDAEYDPDDLDYAFGVFISVGGI